MDEIVRAPQARGLDRVESHERFVIVNGSASPDALDALHNIKGFGPAEPGLQGALEAQLRRVLRRIGPDGTLAVGDCRRNRVLVRLC